MSEMVERVARRLAEVMHGTTGEGLWREDAIDLARAAIEAMRSPTDDMLAGGRDGLSSYDPGWTRGETIIDEIYRGMIDAALSEAGVTSEGEKR